MPKDLDNVEEMICPLPSALITPCSGRKSTHVIPSRRARIAMSEIVVTAKGRTVSGAIKSHDLLRNFTAGPTNGPFSIILLSNSG